MQQSNTRCHSQHTQRHGAHSRGPSSFHMQDSAQVFQELDLKEGDCFLDLGCGPGDYAIYAANIVGAQGVVYALERREQAIAALVREADSQALRNVNAMVADITGPLPIEARCVDVCFLATVLHSLDLAQEGETLFREMLRVLKPGGQIAILECKKERQAFGPPEEMRLSPEELEEFVAQYGLTTKRVADLGNNYLIQFNGPENAFV